MAACNILIVEDETHLAQGLLFNLQAEGYEASIAGAGLAALDLLLGNDNFDAVLLDVMLPGKDGFEVLTALREHHRYVPVLMLTARSRPEDVLRGFTAGADDYLAKPFDLSILLARLKNLLRRMAWNRPASTQPRRAGGNQQAWAIAMAKEADRINANIRHLPPAQRQAASLRAQALSSTASALLGSAPPQPPYWKL